MTSTHNASSGALPDEGATLSVAVIVASRGRPQELGELYAALQAQTQPPTTIIFSVTTIDDLPNLRMDSSVARVLGPAGSCVQRNRALEALTPDIDIVAFFDDDYLPRQDTIANIQQLFRAHPLVVGANGRLVADGISGPGISKEDADNLLEGSWKADGSRAVDKAEALYGCNMVFRRDAIGDIRFDENLPLNGWQEDIDFSAMVGRRGQLIKTPTFVGVHRGVKGARVSGRRFGFSQIVNPAYLARKGTMRRTYALKIALQNIAANMVKSFGPEPWVDRKGRLKGNLLGLAALATGRADPRRILEV